MKISISDYLLENVLRHYETLSSCNVDRNNLRAVNARRVARKEIEKVKAIIDTQKTNDKPI